MPASLVTLAAWHWLAFASAAGLLVTCLVAGGRGLLRNHWVLLGLAGLVWSAVLALRPGELGQPMDALALVTEFAFLSVWGLALLRLLRGPYGRSMPQVIQRLIVLFWGFLAVAGLGAAWVSLDAGPSDLLSAGFFAVCTAAALVLLALAAQLRRDAPVENPLVLKALVRGAALFASLQVLTFGTGLLVGHVTPALLALRAVAVAASYVLILRAVVLRPQWSLAIFVSPQARAYAPRLLATLFMLVVLLALAPLGRAVDPAVVQPLAVAFIGSIGAPVLALLFSQRLSARLRVFLSKHFMPFRYDYREEWLRLIDTLASPEQRLPLPERVIKAVAQIVGSPAGLLWMRRGTEGVFVCAAAWNTRMWSDAKVSPQDPVVRFMFERQWILDTAEIARDPSLYSGLRRPEWLEQFPDALLVVPLIGNEVLIGFIVLLQASSAFRLSFEEIDLLRTSGRQVAAHLAQYEADQQLAEAKQFEAFNRLTAFVMHDLKNLIAQQSLVVRNAARHKSNPAFFEDAIATIDNSVARMNKLLQQLQSGEATGRRSRVRLIAAVQDAIERCRGRTPEPRLVEADGDLHADLDRDRLAMVMAHLVRNAQEATREDGHVEVSLRRELASAVITIEDDGCGMDPEFIRTRLFRPFDSTKGSKGMGIGAYQARSFVLDAGGTLDVSSEPGRGTRITIRLPLSDVSAESEHL